MTEDVKLIWGTIKQCTCPKPDARLVQSGPLVLFVECMRCQERGGYEETPDAAIAAWNNGPHFGEAASERFALNLTCAVLAAINEYPGCCNIPAIRRAVAEAKARGFIISEYEIPEDK